MARGMFDLSGKVAVVTGAGSGIGEAIARGFAEAGAKVYVAEKNADAGIAVAESLVRAGRSAQFVETDVAIEDSCKACAAIVLEDNAGRCDILVNNAGV